MNTLATMGALLRGFGPPLLLVLLVSTMLAIAAHGRRWRSAAGMATASRAAVAIGLFGMLALLARAFELAGGPPTARPGPPVWVWFVYPLCGTAVGGLLFESLRLRVARKGGDVDDPAGSEGTLLVLVALAGVAVLMTFGRF